MPADQLAKLKQAGHALTACLPGQAGLNLTWLGRPAAHSCIVCSPSSQKGLHDLGPLPEMIPHGLLDDKRAVSLGTNTSKAPASRDLMQLATNSNAILCQLTTARRPPWHDCPCQQVLGLLHMRRTRSRDLSSGPNRHLHYQRAAAVRAGKIQRKGEGGSVTESLALAEFRAVPNQAEVLRDKGTVPVHINQVKRNRTRGRAHSRIRQRRGMALCAPDTGT